MAELVASLQVWIGAVGGTLGSVLGIYNFVQIRNREKRESESEKADWGRWVEFLGSQRNVPGALILNPEAGSDQHLWAERMVSRGMLQRTVHGHFYKIAE